MFNEFCEICENSTKISEENETHNRRNNIIIIIFSSLFLSLSIIFEFVFHYAILSQVLAGVVVLLSGFEIIKKGILKLLQKKISINLLMTIATIGSFLIGHGGEGASLMLLYFLAEFLEDYARDHSKKSITALMKLAPDTAMVKVNGTFKELHTHNVNIGDLIQVKPGGNIPLDGVLETGASNINESSLTGESIPVYKTVGDEVFAGTINGEGYIEIRVTKTSNQTFLAKIKDMIEEAKDLKSNTEKFIDKFARYYTPIMILLAISIMILPPLFFQLPLYDWIYRGLTILVISCPCALALATPISTISALTSGSKNGILIKGGKFIEEMNQIQVIAFDKTGTLTEGTLEVKDILTYDGLLENWLQIVLSLESLSEHPISKAIINEAKTRNIKAKPIESFKALTGKGVVGEYNNQKYYLGNKDLFDELKVPVPHKDLDSLTREGKTVVMFGNNQKILGLISLQDKIRKEAKDVINELKNRKIETLLISGDNRGTVRSAQKILGIDHVQFELKPDDKQSIIQEYISRDKRIAMVGDGVNDAPSLALANVGIAMGGIGSDVSLETADVTLMKDDLRGLITFMDISKKTNYVIRENINIAIFVKLLFIVLTFLGLMTLYLAVGIGDLGVTLLVILNAFRITKVKKYSGKQK
ncbi:MAG: heavy metal translocating P-type ATPase [Candidatus Helarchaeota archaeon]